MVLRLLLAALLLAQPLWTWVLSPDPLWIPGVYDGGDSDDLVAAIDPSKAPVVPHELVSVAGPALDPGGLPPADPAAPRRPDRLFRGSRSPPRG